jgi:hypothetical protein
MENLYETANTGGTVSVDELIAGLGQFLQGNSPQNNQQLFNEAQKAVVGSGGKDLLTEVIIPLITSGGLAKLIDAFTRYRVATAQINTGFIGSYGQPIDNRRNFAQPTVVYHTLPPTHHEPPTYR